MVDRQLQRRSRTPYRPSLRPHSPQADGSVSCAAYHAVVSASWKLFIFKKKILLCPPWSVVLQVVTIYLTVNGTLLRGPGRRPRSRACPDVRFPHRSAVPAGLFRRQIPEPVGLLWSVLVGSGITTRVGGEAMYVGPRACRTYGSLATFPCSGLLTYAHRHKGTKTYQPNGLP